MLKARGVSPARVRQVQTAPDQIAAALKQLIADGTYPSGEFLPSEEELSVLFGVSRPTVQIALRRLKASHVLTTVRGRRGGHQVAEFSAWQLGEELDGFLTVGIGSGTVSYRQLLEVRHDLELLSAASAARHRTEADLAVLETLPHPGEAGTPDPELALRYDLAFHRHLAASSHNSLLDGFVSATVVAFHRCAIPTASLDPVLLLAHLDEVLAGVQAGDPVAARSAMERHLATSMDLLDDVA